MGGGASEARHNCPVSAVICYAVMAKRSLVSFRGSRGCRLLGARFGAPGSESWLPLAQGGSKTETKALHRVCHPGLSLAGIHHWLPAMAEICLSGSTWGLWWPTCLTPFSLSLSLSHTDSSRSCREEASRHVVVCTDQTQADSPTPARASACLSLARYQEPQSGTTLQPDSGSCSGAIPETSLNDGFGGQELFNSLELHGADD